MPDPVDKSDVEKLRKAVLEQKESAKLLIRRDLELTRANEKLHELDKAKSHFISIVAHQLRTPLSGIKWSLNMILGETLGPLTDEQRVFLKRCYESNERLIVLINDMLGADRIDSGKLKYHFKPTGLSNLIDNVLFETVPIVNDKKLEVAFAHKDGLPQVFVDEEKISLAFQNILENAFKYTPKGGKVEINLEVDGEFIKISVKDYGIGIPEEEQKNVFSRFFRAKNAIKVETDGSGLGLFIAKGIIEKHGGKIWFESKEQEGTSFHFTVPISR